MDNNMPYQQMVSPYMGKSPMMNQPTEQLQDMYPDIYNRVFPKVQQMCMLKDNPMYHPSREMVESMADDIYRDTLMELGETDDDQEDQRQFGGPGFGGPGFGPGFGGPGFGPGFGGPGFGPGFGGPGFGPGFGGPGFGPGFGFGRRRHLRDLISILLIRELLRRRGHRY